MFASLHPLAVADYATLKSRPLADVHRIRKYGVDDASFRVYLTVAKQHRTLDTCVGPYSAVGSNH